ncbi:hypothetical protein KC675_01670 [Candidatus Dojkabacteria bacterium]|uniref:Uncharacterized protein n=1 Tax=Candidatus Dojkabacteria bacterium TaxID=2099670 RepID=A0A955I8Q7_9BACT|nr:hypothetical protein [Candidatus Dojkabacteria bacterium]
MKKLKITPEMFVSKPFIKCPKCGEDVYGRLMINRRSFVRRCNNCMHSESYKLPDIKKKIIYLDQMAISNMMKSIRTTDPKKQTQIQNEWKVMFEKLDRLVKLQLIICPYSQVHEHESIVTPVFKDLKQMYEHLGNGVVFYNIDTIIRYQFYEAFTKWLGVKVEPITIHNVVHGNLNGWQDTIRVSIEFSNDRTDYIQELKMTRDVSSLELAKVFNRWKTETQKTFMDWFNEEKNAYGPAYWQMYLKSVLGYSLSGISNLVFSEKDVLIIHLGGILRQSGKIKEEEVFTKLAEFFQSEQATQIPFVINYSMLAAGLANQAAHGGRTRLPNMGTSNDMAFISAFTPYCDVLFIDNAFKQNIKEGDKILKLGLSDKFYSANDFKGFFEYLDNIEASASKRHLNKVKEVYGEDYGQPYTTMYDK